MSVVIIGGSFNPVHIGHLILAEEARVALGADRAFLVPASRPPHKAVPSGASDEDRLEMLRIVESRDPGLEIIDCEIRRGGVSYTVETLEWFMNERPGEGRPYLVIGDDLAPGFGSWKSPDRIAKLSRIILARRLSQAAPIFPWPHGTLDNLMIPVSSSLVRERIRSGGAYRHLVPDGVFEYIRTRGLYSGPSETMA